MKRELGRNERDASRGFWAGGEFVLWSDAQKQTEKAYLAWVLKEPALRLHLLSKQAIAALPEEVQAKLKKDR